MTPTTPNKDSKKHRRVLYLILLMAILLRLPVALYLGNEVSELPGIQDQISYDALARSLLAGRGYSFTENWYPFTAANTPTAHWSFLYPLYLAGVYAVTDLQPVVARLLQGVLGGALTCLLIYQIGRRTVNEETGLVGAALAAVYGYFIYYNVALMTETFFIVLVLYSLLLGLLLAEKPTLRRWILLGLALGTAGLLRQTVLLFVPFLLLWLLIELRKERILLWHYAIPVLVMTVLVAPWIVRNYMAYGQFPLLNSNAGYALFASNNPSLETTWRNDRVVVPVPEDLAGLNEGELNGALTRRGVEFILADPVRYALLTLSKIPEYVKFWPAADSTPMSNLVRVFSFGLYLPFMLAGLYFSLSHARRFTLLYLFMVVHSGIHLLSWPSLRYRLPVDALLMIFAAMALLELVRLFVVWRRDPSPAFKT